MAQYNFIYWHASTLEPFIRETNLSNEAPRVAEKNSRQGLMVILNSVTARQKKIFRVLAEYQLNNPEARGILVHKLLEICSSKHHIAQSEHELREMLQTYVDHSMVAFRGMSNELLYSPLSKGDLAKILEQIPELD